MKTNKERFEFRHRVGLLLSQLGAVRIDGHWSLAFRLETRAGSLECAPMDGWLATRFDDVPRACELLNPKKEWGNRLNPHSGKWNFHFSDLVTVDSALDFVRAELSKILPAAEA